ncbi:MAG: HAMP domain-containing histidine kinase, partial [Bacteroidetes bacterium]|nr:HAMP domain-containing histidine kinase [Bacteroidota bacterium]
MYTPEFLLGGGEMGQRIREFDWSATPLGPVDGWPQSLRTCIRIMLTSQQPIWIGWGKELIKLYNDPYKAIVGGKHPWALGKPASVVWKEIWWEIGPMLQTVMEQDEGTYVESRLLIMERNGYPEETYYTFSYTPVPGEGGGTAGMICFNSDDTARIQGERQMRTLMQLGRRLADPRSFQDVVTRTLKVLMDNPQDFPFVQFRLAGEEAELFPDCQLAVACHGPQVVDAMDKRVAGMTKGAWEIGPHTGVILPIFHPTTREAYGYLVVGINPYRLPDEKYMGFFSLVADQITGSLGDLHALEAEREKSEALMEIDRAKTIFFSNISHEFRTPLTLLLGPIQDLLDDPSAKEVNRYRMGVAYRNVLRMQKLVNTLLDFSRIEAGRMDAKYSRVDIVAFTRELASSFRSAVEKAGMQLLLSSGPISGDVYVDVDHWEQIMLNLLSNALKYTQEGSIAVHIEQAGDELLVRISDTGVGIPEDQLGKIFERFHRAENVQGRSQEGTGIGLAMVKELVRMHHGRISVTSQLGRGSTFTVAIPVGRKHLPADKIVEPSIVGLKHAESFVTEAMKWLPAGEDEAGGAGGGAGGDGAGVAGGVEGSVAASGAARGGVGDAGGAAGGGAGGAASGGAGGAAASGAAGFAAGSVAEEG